ncbi:Hypothetical protein PHPALM_20048 [Phytophthora palmivora]|uniref:Uncharacterized protein n=1 Tax=Phytophthora palmivora TaxID=4796 RepID=A0A2P4XFV5_9STRA|nr:Hypothetical protein PHPALM_20048 [Phytophthora palmivora]
MRNHVVYAQIDEALRAGGLDSVGGGWRGSGRMWKEDGSGCFLYIDKQDIPYNFQQTCKNMWRVKRMPLWEGKQELFTGVSDPENTMVFKFRVQMRQPYSVKIQFLQRVVVVRRYEEQGRMILIWRTLAEGDGIFAGMHADETGWSVVTPSTGTSKPETVLRVCIRHIPMNLRSVRSCQPRPRLFTTMVLDNGTDEASKFALTLEKLLHEE